MTVVILMGPAWGQRGVPTLEQIAWHEMEIEMFLCLDPCTWQGREYDDHSTALDQINPSQLDTEQWCGAAELMGAKQVLFVAKHTGGFCWWPTETTEYCVRNIGWKGGKGDVLGDLAVSCRRHGLKLGIYIYPGDDQWGAPIGSGGKTNDPAKQEAYNQVLRQQWTEVLSGYGEISELWFDGSCVIELGDIIKQYAPKAMVFQGPHATLRWPGNEQGITPEPAWQTVAGAAAKSGGATGVHSDPEGDVWLPMEMDTTLLDHKWFWGPNTDHMIKPLDKLMDIYFKSVGRGCVLLLNATPDTTGLIPESHMQRYREFGEGVRGVYANKKGATAGAGAELELRFERPETVTHAVIREDIAQGHTVRRYRVEGLAGVEWRLLSEGKPIGYKRIDRFPATRVDALRLRVTESAGVPNILEFAAYETSGIGAGAQAGTADVAAPVAVDGWKKVAVTSEWQTVEVDLTPLIRRPGECIEIRESGGGGSIIETAGTPLPRLNDFGLN
ncbi:MAG: alpha-L-fucosidase [Candidatus Hydrogenedentes bacterium]|nr:alpha-L-fucosidase [Candidatus Hydrogenedentota bacterium]